MISEKYCDMCEQKIPAGGHGGEFVITTGNRDDVCLECCYPCLDKLYEKFKATFERAAAK